MGRNSEKDVCAYRECQKSVQGNSNPRTREKRTPYRGEAESLKGSIEV